jgi:hypothetical protein
MQRPQFDTYNPVQTSSVPNYNPYAGVISEQDINHILNELSSAADRETFNQVMLQFEESFVNKFKARNPPISGKLPFGSVNRPFNLQDAYNEPPSNFSISNNPRSGSFIRNPNEGRAQSFMDMNNMYSEPQMGQSGSSFYRANTPTRGRPEPYMPDEMYRVPMYERPDYRDPLAFSMRDPTKGFYRESRPEMRDPYGIPYSPQPMGYGAYQDSYATPQFMPPSTPMGNYSRDVAQPSMKNPLTESIELRKLKEDMLRKSTPQERQFSESFRRNPLEDSVPSYGGMRGIPGTSRLY